MAQQTAMQTLFINLESIDIKVPQGIKDIYLQMEKEQIIDSYEQGVADENEGNRNGQFTNAEKYYNETYEKKVVNSK